MKKSVGKIKIKYVKKNHKETQQTETLELLFILQKNINGISFLFID